MDMKSIYCEQEWQYDVYFMFLFVRSYYDGRFAMSDAERSQIDKFYEKSVFHEQSLTYNYCHLLMVDIDMNWNKTSSL